MRSSFFFVPLLAILHFSVVAALIARQATDDSNNYNPSLPTDSTVNLTVNYTGPVRCFDPSKGQLPTNLTGCRLTLRRLHTFPQQYREQEFLMHVRPKIAGGMEPPFGFFAKEASCTFKLYSINPTVADKFSWHQARLLGQSIVSECDEQGHGVGGWAAIGSKGWLVVMEGRIPTPEPPSSLPSENVGALPSVTS